MSQYPVRRSFTASLVRAQGWGPGAPAPSPAQPSSRCVSPCPALRLSPPSVARGWDPAPGASRVCSALRCSSRARPRGGSNARATPPLKARPGWKGSPSSPQRPIALGAVGGILLLRLVLDAQPFVDFLLPGPFLRQPPGGGRRELSDLQGGRGAAFHSGLLHKLIHQGAESPTE